MVSEGQCCAQRDVLAKALREKNISYYSLSQRCSGLQTEVQQLQACAAESECEHRAELARLLQQHAAATAKAEGAHSAELAAQQARLQAALEEAQRRHSGEQAQLEARLAAVTAEAAMLRQQMAAAELQARSREVALGEAADELEGQRAEAVGKVRRMP